MKEPFAFAGLTVAPGAREGRVLGLTLAGVATKLPLFVLNGAHEGPTVVVTAGIHGAEYVGIETAYRLALDTDPAQVHGQLVVAPIASMTAYAQRAIYIAPPDDKNLNRQFPGDPDGSFAQQLAAWLFQNVIRRADVYIDLHGGDMNEALVPFSIIRRTGDADLDARALALAEAFGIPHIVTSVVGGSTYAAAAEAGIPAVLAEVGGQGLWDHEQVGYFLAGLQRALAHVGLLRVVDKGAAPATRQLSQFVWLRSSHDGLFYPTVSVGDEVQAGQRLGHVADFLGGVAEEVIAPASGTILFLVTTLAMNDGDPLLAIAA